MILTCDTKIKISSKHHQKSISSAGFSVPSYLLLGKLHRSFWLNIVQIKQIGKCNFFNFLFFNFPSPIEIVRQAVGPSCSASLWLDARAQHHPCVTDLLLHPFCIIRDRANALELYVSIRIPPKRDCLEVLSKQLYGFLCMAGVGSISGGFRPFKSDVGFG